MSALEISWNGVDQWWVVVDVAPGEETAREVARFTSLHDAEQFVIRNGEDEQ